MFYVIFINILLFMPQNKEIHTTYLHRCRGSADWINGRRTGSMTSIHLRLLARWVSTFYVQIFITLIYGSFLVHQVRNLFQKGAHKFILRNPFSGPSERVTCRKYYSLAHQPMKIISQKLQNFMRKITTHCLRLKLFRYFKIKNWWENVNRENLSGLPGGGGSRKIQKIRTPIFIFNEILLSKLDIRGTSFMDGPLYFST